MPPYHIKGQECKKSQNVYKIRLGWSTPIFPRIPFAAGNYRLANCKLHLNFLLDTIVICKYLNSDFQIRG